jgi:hypothetical protein
VFRYDFQVGRFQTSISSLVYSCSVVLVFYFTHSQYQKEYLDINAAIYSDLIMEPTRYIYRFSSATFLLVHVVQIWRREEIVKFLNKGLNLMEQLSDTGLIDTKQLDMLIFCLFAFSFGFVYNACGIGGGMVELSVKVNMPHGTKIMLWSAWILLTSLAVRVIRVLNAQIESLQPQAADETLNGILRVYCQLYDLIQTLGSLSSTISMIQLIRSFIGLAGLVI